MRERIRVIIDIPPRETLKKFVKRWYGYDSCNYSDYAKSVFDKRTKGSIYVERYREGHCTIFGTEETTGTNFIKYSSTFTKNLGKI